jgi:hypothetical protein
MRVYIVLIVAAILIIATAVLTAAPLKSMTYYVSESYVIPETYYVTETQTVDIPLDYKVISTEIANCWWRVSSDCSVTIKNTDSTGGYFRVEYYMATQTTIMAPSKTVTKTAWQFLTAGRQETVTVRHEGDHIGNLTYSITPPTKEVTTSQQVPKTREIIQYRDVEKSKKITFLEYWTQ